MLINTTKNKKYQLNNQSPKHPIHTQSTQTNNHLQHIIKLTKQNHILKTQIDCLQHQIIKQMANKQRYKQKYKKLKQQVTISHQLQQQLSEQNMIRQEGKIYSNKKKCQNFEEQQSTKSYINMRNFNSSEIQNHNKNENISEEKKRSIIVHNQINCNKEKQQFQQNQKSQIPKCISSIEERIKQISNLLNLFFTKLKPIFIKNNSQYQNPIDNLNKRIDNFENLMIEFLDLIKQMNGKIKVESKNILEDVRNQFDPPSIQMQFQINDDVVKSHQFYQIELRNQKVKQKEKEEYQEQRHSGVQPPQRDLQTQQQNKQNNSQKLLQQVTKKRIMLMKNQNQKHSSSDTNRHLLNPHSRTTDEHKQFNSQHFQKNKPTIMHVPFYEEIQNNESDKAQSENSSERLQQWKMLKQIGKQLRNWKFCMVESSLSMGAGQEYNKQQK